MITRFADLLAVQRGNLVGTDDQCAAGCYAQADGPGFLLCQPQRGGFGGFARQGGFIDIRCNDLERQAQSGE